MKKQSTKPILKLLLKGGTGWYLNVLIQRKTKVRNGKEELHLLKIMELTMNLELKADQGYWFCLEKRLKVHSLVCLILVLVVISLCRVLGKVDGITVATALNAMAEKMGY